jgi:hypothetical protein
VSYTVLRVVESGVVLLREHEDRFRVAGPAALGAFQRFASEASPGLYALTWRNGELSVQVRTTTSLFEGIPVRYMVSPLAGGHSIPKTPPPNPYGVVRQPGVATLLTSADGLEIFESCTAGVVAWEDDSFVVPPEDRPRLVSTTVTAIERALRPRREPICRGDSRALALVNAVSGLVIPVMPERPSFPAAARQRFNSMLEEATGRPR